MTLELTWCHGVGENPYSLLPADYKKLVMTFFEWQGNVRHIFERCQRIMTFLQSAALVNFVQQTHLLVSIKTMVRARFPFSCASWSLVCAQKFFFDDLQRRRHHLREHWEHHEEQQHW